ncbi:MAG: hypothetical protein L0215_15495 [Gemmataceae bacterium]|nr:hypothetical protein [Gemmataceae bacterium]
MSLRDFFFGMTAYLGTGVILILFVFPPLNNWLLLRVHYTADEIERGNLCVVQVKNGQEILFSNGDSRPYEGRAKTLCIASMVGLAVSSLGLVSWALARWHKQLISPESAEE